MSNAGMRLVHCVEPKCGAAFYTKQNTNGAFPRRCPACRRERKKVGQQRYLAKMECEDSRAMAAAAAPAVSPCGGPLGALHVIERWQRGE